MITNVSNELKNKVINHEILTSEETENFIKYMITKAKIIVDHMYTRKNHNYMYLFFEICFSYNLAVEPYNETKNLYSILNINNKKYLIDMNFNNNKIPELKHNKYIEYTDDIYHKYLNIIEGDINE